MEIKEIQKITAGFMDIPAEIDIRSDRIMVMFEYVVPDDIKVNTKITKKGKIKFTNLDNFLLYRIVKVFYFI